MRDHIFDLSITGSILVEYRIIINGTLLTKWESISGIIVSKEGIQRQNHPYAEDNRTRFICYPNNQI